MMLLQKGREWKETREKFTTAFTSGKLRQMFPVLDDYGRKLVKFIKSKDANKVDIIDNSVRYSTDTLSRTFVGMETYCLEEDSEVYWKIKSAITPTYESGLRGICYFFKLETVVDWLKLTFPQRAALDYFADVFQHLVKLCQDGNGKISNLIDIVSSLKNSDTYTKKFTYGDRKAVGQPFMFFIAGENTIITSLAYTLYELAKHPQVQSKLRAEVAEATRDGSGFTYENIVGMKYMEMVVQGNTLLISRGLCLCVALAVVYDYSVGCQTNTPRDAHSTLMFYVLDLIGKITDPFQSFQFTFYRV
nr:unnamed protein product [Callosobruchus analis]